MTRERQWRVSTFHTQNEGKSGRVTEERKAGAEASLFSDIYSYPEYGRKELRAQTSPGPLKPDLQWNPTLPQEARSLVAKGKCGLLAWLCKRPTPRHKQTRLRQPSANLLLTWFGPLWAPGSCLGNSSEGLSVQIFLKKAWFHSLIHSVLF